MSKIYGTAPIEVAKIECNIEEMFFYQYLPIRIMGHKYYLKFAIPDQLNIFWPLLWQIEQDFIKMNGEDEFYNTNIYLTAKRLFVTSGCGLNRDGWHTDGFGSDDINYIWCDTHPMKYVTGKWNNISDDHNESLKQFQQIGQSGVNTNWCEPNTIYRLDDTVIHAQDEYSGDPFIRTFVKVSFSKEKYNLKGNSHNYLLSYEWEMKDRNVERNHPVK